MSYSREVERLKSFNNPFWQQSFVSKEELARYGCYYTGRSDVVCCFFCYVQIGFWELNDNVLLDHIKWSPNCPLLRKRDTDNVPIDPNFLDSIPDGLGGGYDVCGCVYSPLMTAPRTNVSRSSSISGSPLPPSPPPSSNSKYPNYDSYEKRLNSFKLWPKSMKQKPSQMSEAGFFYTGEGDRVKCFYCGGGLTHWLPDDNPWEQHAMFYNTCLYLQLHKDNDFIELWSSMHPSKMSPSPEPEPPAETSLEPPETSPDPEPPAETSPDPSEKPPLEGYCKICFANPSNILYLPCAHLVSCSNCALRVHNCPICRQPYVKVMKIYPS